MMILKQPLLLIVGVLLVALVHHQVFAQGEGLGLGRSPILSSQIKTSIPQVNSPLAPADRTTLQQTFKVLGDRPNIQQVAERFLGAPYQADMLDRTEPEKLTLSLQKFDCVLFVEAVLAIARAEGDRSPEGLVARVQAQRYRGGVMDGYCSRLHYFSDWIGDNQQRGLVQDLTPSLGGVAFKPHLAFMTQNWSKYPRLVKNRANRDCINKMEIALDAQTRTYLPTADIAQHYDQLQSGDIVAIATAVPGLDVTHTGLVYRTAAGEVGLIHAAPRAGVIISRDLQRYVERVDQAIGIMVARPNLAVPNLNFPR